MKSKGIEEADLRVGAAHSATAAAAVRSADQAAELDHSLDQIDPYEFVRQKYGKGRTRFSQMVNDPDGDFPRAVRLNGTCLGFIRSEWVAHMRNLPRVEPSRKPRKPPFTGLAGTNGKGKRGDQDAAAL